VRGSGQDRSAGMRCLGGPGGLAPGTLTGRLLDSLPTSRGLLLVNYRPEYKHAWARKTFYSQLRIDPLTAESAEELLNALLGVDGPSSRSSGC